MNMPIDPVEYAQNRLPDTQHVTTMVKHEAYQMGYDAYWAGDGPKECRLLSYHARTAWAQGWNAARKETHR